MQPLLSVRRTGRAERFSKQKKGAKKPEGPLLPAECFSGKDAAFGNGLHCLGDLPGGHGQGKADVAFARGAKAGARGAQHAAFFHQVHAEIHAAGVLGRDGRPDEHAAVAVGHIPADGAQAAAQGVPALLVDGALIPDHVQGAGEGGDGRLLDGQEHPEVDLPPQPAESRHHVGPPHQEADPRPGDVEALGQAEELHPHVHGAGGVEQAVALGPVKDDVAVGVVVDQEDVVLLGEGHQLLVEGGGAHAAHGVGGQGDDHILGPAGDVLRNVLYIG